MCSEVPFILNITEMRQIACYMQRDRLIRVFVCKISLYVHFIYISRKRA
jgi:hypothetical protein